MKPFKPNGNPSELAFFYDLLELYRINSNKIKKKILISDEQKIVDFCSDYDGKLNYKNICKLVIVFSNVLKKRMPDHIHSRILLGPHNECVEEYANYSMSLKNPIFGIINLNANNYKFRSLGSNGHIARMQLK